MHLRRRWIPVLAVGVALIVVLGVHLIGGGAGAAATAFTPYGGHHRIGDMIGPNAKVVAVDSDGRPTAVVSTDGNPPVVWAYERQDASRLKPVKGRPVSHFDDALWSHPACPSVICGPSHAAGHAATVVRPPPPALDVDVCRALTAADLGPVLGGSPLTASNPETGTCVWDNGRGGVQIEVGGPAWWPYLLALPGLYRTAGDALVDTQDGLHVAVQRGPVTVVLLTYTDPSAPSWVQIARKVAAWATAN